MISRPALARVLAPVTVVLVSLAATALADDTVVAAPGRLTDDDFYRLVSCGAPPGGDCAHDPLRWEAERPIRVALRRIDPGFVGRQRPRALAALTRALRELNAAGAAFHLARVGPADRAEIAVYFLDLDHGDTIAGTGIDWVDGATIDEIATLIAVDPGRSRILSAAIIVGAELETQAFEAAMLKAMTRAMGLTTEIDAPGYASVSALAHAELAATELGPQDRAALRLHYAAPTD